MEQKTQKNWFVSEIIAFDLVAVKFHYCEENTCRRQSMCQEKPLRFFISLWETFSKLVSLKVMKTIWLKSL